MSRKDVEWKSNIPKISRALRIGEKKGVLAAANIVRNDVKDRLVGGYTSGDFVTGLAIASVFLDGPHRRGRQVTARVFTDLRYPLFWELGHFNIFSRQFERQPIWVPAMVDTRNLQVAVYRGLVNLELILAV